MFCTILSPLSVSFFFYCSGHHRDLHSFPTRRSSDLPLCSNWSHRQSPGRFHDGSPFPPSALGRDRIAMDRSEEHTSELQSHSDLVCRLLLEKKKEEQTYYSTSIAWSVGS